MHVFIEINLIDANANGFAVNFIFCISSLSVLYIMNFAYVVKKYSSELRLSNKLMNGF